MFEPHLSFVNTVPCGPLLWLKFDAFRPVSKDFAPLGCYRCRGIQTPIVSIDHRTSNPA